MAGAPACAQPYVNLASDLDATTTVQLESITQSSIEFLTDLTATGEALVTWRAEIGGGAGGAGFSIVRGSLAGSNRKLADFVYVSATDASGQVPFTPSGKFADGAPLTAVSTANDFLGSSTGTGVSRFSIRLTIKVPATAGSGNLSTVLTIIGAPRL